MPFPPAASMFCRRNREVLLTDCLTHRTLARSCRYCALITKINQFPQTSPTHSPNNKSYCYSSPFCFPALVLEKQVQTINRSFPRNLQPYDQTPCLQLAGRDAVTTARNHAYKITNSIQHTPLPAVVLMEGKETPRYHRKNPYKRMLTNKP